MTLINRDIRDFSDEELAIFVYQGEPAAVAEYERRQQKETS